MLNLALDTATRHGRFALADATGVLVDRPHNVGGNFADALLPIVQEVLASAGRGRRDLTGIGVTAGPGSFTGVRIGVATAKGLAWALGCELVAVNSLEAMAAALLTEHPHATAAVPVLDARRGELFCGVFRRTDAWVEPLVDPAALVPDVWWERVVQALPAPEAAVYGGDGAGLLLGQGDDLRSEFRERGAPTLRRWSAAHPPTAASLAVAMGVPDALPRVHPFTLVPNYLRVSDAEVKRGVDLTPADPSEDVSSYRSKRSDP